MRIYTVHIAPPAGANGREPRVAFVKEGFSWPAFFFNWVWALFKGMWLTALVLFFAGIAAVAAIERLSLSPTAQSVASLAFILLCGIFGNDLVRWELGRRGYREAGVVAAPNLAAAEQRAFERIPALAGA